MSNSLKEIFLLVVILIITFILYIIGIHQLEPYLDHLFKLIVVEIVALFLLVFYDYYLKQKKPRWIWKIVGVIKEFIRQRNLSKAIENGNKKEFERLLLDNARDKITSNDEEKQYIGNQEIYELAKRGFMSKKIRILWVEDEAKRIDGLVRPLKNDGHEIIIAENEKDALIKLGNNKFDLIILDIIIPTGEKDTQKFIPYVGMRLLEKILIEMKLGTPIIVLSVVGDPEIIKKALEMGVKKFLIKGAFRPSNLKKEVYETLGFVDT